MDDRPAVDVDRLVGAADRLDALAEMAELMGDDDGAVRLRTQAEHRRLEAMAVLDADAPPELPRRDV